MVANQMVELVGAYTYSKHVQPPNSKGHPVSKKLRAQSALAQTVHSKTGSVCFFVNCLISFDLVPSIYTCVILCAYLSICLPYSSLSSYKWDK